MYELKLTAFRSGKWLINSEMASSHLLCIWRVGSAPSFFFFFFFFFNISSFKWKVWAHFVEECMLLIIVLFVKGLLGYLGLFRWLGSLTGL